ncbi:Holliday junction branch migration protein RuvA [Algivirga pacifica]|uniref:Holliday junction branch migration complex subunit RuvA n=1 Tax=Algivirga pacifica TaxID=1162670 RepID=A0ABP9D3B2_9BACT
MYNYIKGKLALKTPTYLVIDVGGIGYEVNIPLSTYSKLKGEEQCQLFTHFYVKEDHQALYGFLDKSEKELFLLLIGISGVGPSTGLAFLSTLSPLEIQQAILSDDVKTVQSVKGVGAKTAQRVIIELKDKVVKLQIEGQEAGEPALVNSLSPEVAEAKEQALEALMALGFSKSIAEKSLKVVIRKHGTQLKVEEMIKLVLKQN